MILDSQSSIFCELVISSAQMIIVITCNAMEGFATTPNGWGQLLSYLWQSTYPIVGSLPIQFSLGHNQMAQIHNFVYSSI